jgi:hypothetical protein
MVKSDIVRVYQILSGCQGGERPILEQKSQAFYPAQPERKIEAQNPMTIKVDKKMIRQDPFLRICMKTGIPLTILAVISLWVGQYAGSMALGMVFIFSTAMAVVIGLAYNIRFVMLSIRDVKRQQAEENNKP